MLRFSLFAFILLAPSCSWTDQITPVDIPEAMTYAQSQLPRHGVLQKTSDGLLYLKVTDRYIYELLPFLPDVLSPPPYFGPGLIGAHISIIQPKEINWAAPPALPALGTRYSFNLGHFAWVVPQNAPKTSKLSTASKIYMLTVESPDLIKIRTGAGLPPQFEGQDLHITIGVQYLESTTPPLEFSKNTSSRFSGLETQELSEQIFDCKEEGKGGMAPLTETKNRKDTRRA